MTSMMQPEARSTRRLPLLLTGGALGVFAVSMIWLPFRADQAVMFLVGRDVVHGRHLYTEIFDAKQPGMHLWYGAISVVAGSAQPVFQALSLLVGVLTAWLMYRLVADRLESGWVRTWAPLMMVGGVLLSVDEFQLGQAEMLLCAPAVGALLLVAGTGATARPTPWRYLAAGVLIGVVVMVKTVLVAVPGLAILCYLLLARRGLRHTLVALAAMALGGLVVPALVVGWLWRTGDLPAALFAWFVYPGQVLELEGIRSLGTLWIALRRFVVLFAGVGLLLLWRLPTIVRRRDPLDVALAGWLVAGLLAYAVQVWWSYYLVILIPAMVVLAVRQLDDLSWRTGPVVRRGMAAAAVLTVPIVVYAVIGLVGVVADGGGITAASRAATADRIAQYDAFRAELTAAGVRPADTLHVLGDARYQLLADRPYALGTNGWSAEFVPPQRWIVVADELRTARPTMVFLDPSAAAAMHRRGPEAEAVLQAAYDVVRTTQAGTWYRLRE